MPRPAAECSATAEVALRLGRAARVARWVGLGLGVALCAAAGCRDRGEPTLRAARVGDESSARAGAAEALPFADAGGAPGDAGAAAHAGDEFVDLHELDPSIVIDMRYAGTNNFTGMAIYPVARCLLRRAVAERLVAVQRALQRRGRGLKVWDCYRPVAVQRRFWELVPDARYVAPVTLVDGKVVSGSKHNRGAAVDLTMVDSHGSEVAMPTDFDDFSKRAHRSYRGGSVAARDNAAELARVMGAQGFIPLATEWWHFDAAGWQRYPIADQPLEQ